MNIISKLIKAANVVKAGESLANPAAWKRIQILTPIFVVIIGSVLQLVGIEVDEIQIKTMSDGFATLGVILFNCYFTVATTDKIGMPNKSKNGI